MGELAKIFEMLMIISFGLAWPTSVIKSIKARTAKGKSLIFLFIILLGYVFGITGKYISGNINYVLVFYYINFFMVLLDLIIYFYNRRLDKKRGNETIYMLK